MNFVACPDDEQQVTAVRYPATRKIETIPAPPEDSKARTFTSQITHNVEPPSGRRYSYSSQPSSPQLRHKNMPPTTVYRAVDIPFDESPAAYQPKKDENLHTITVVMGTHPVQKGLGFTITIERGRPTIDSVVVGTPADRAGLLIGDRVISVNGEELKDKYPSAINRLLHDAARLGEAEVVVERKDAKIAQVKSLSSLENFDKARSVFTETRTVDSYAEFKRKHSRGMSFFYFFFRRELVPVHHEQIFPAHVSITRFQGLRQPEPYQGGIIQSPALARRQALQRVHTMKAQRIVRNTGVKQMVVHQTTEFSYRRASDEEPRLIRNYDLPPAHTTTAKVTSSVTSTPMTSSRRVQDESVSAVLKRSTLPRNRVSREVNKAIVYAMLNRLYKL
ncbi:PDZ/DHR/GLGF domain protein [Ancylostoma duodenale]|uniref:PDZ/DHR/GLGF domain protein n=1 Tax=Ancylostoma duodenale TaxID=51022 RepID=A0A0C2GQN2_9BILA|nr:PDZ/DHR/GLGF domain protein [Ancylostoma duodenale]